jgi:hypothetical protein
MTVEDYWVVIVSEGIKLYPIGTDSWIKDEAENGKTGKEND